MIFSETNGEISKALVKSWAAIDTPKHNSSVSVKTKSGGSYKFEYTDLTGILEAVKEVYKDNKITVMQNAYTTDEGMVAVETTLLHETGEWVKSYPLKFPADKDIQGFGGQATYLKRYSLSAMSGISTEKDDDANYTSGNTATFNQKKASDPQLNKISVLLDQNAKAHGKTKDDVYAGMKDKMKKDMENFTQQEASTAIKMLEGWKNKQKQGAS